MTTYLLPTVDIQQHSRDLTRSLFLRRSSRVAWLLLFVLCTVVLARPALAGLNQWTQTGGPEGGFKFGALVVDPVTPTTLYAGIRSGGGVFKSTNGGANWSAVNTGLNSFIQALAVDPVTPATLYAGTYGGVSGGRPHRHR